MYKRQEEVSQYHIVLVFSYINSIIAHVLQQYNNILDEDFVTLIERLVNTPSVSLSIFLDNNKISKHAFAEVVNFTVDHMITILNQMKEIADKKEFKEFANKLSKVINVLPIFYNIEFIYKYL